MKVTRPAPSVVSHRSSEPAAPAAAAPESVNRGWVGKSGASRAVASAPVASPSDVVSRFYRAFEAKDVDAMGALYAPNLAFKDAIFSFDSSAGATHMWKKLFEVDPNAKLQFTLDSAQGSTVKGHWVADYHVGGRPVHNEVSTTMKVENGKITQHTDDFSWKKWAPQAFPAGALFTLPGLDSLARALVRTFLG